MDADYRHLPMLSFPAIEMARNGCKKVIIVNGHGGNEHLLPFFAQAQLAKPHDYVVYVQPIVDAPDAGPPPRKTTGIDWHAGEIETSKELVVRPDLVHMDRAASESGADLARLKIPENLYTAIWWYARFPYHYSGQGAAATRERGEFEIKTWVSTVVEAIRAVKADQQSLKLQNEFYEKAKSHLFY